MKQVIVKSLKVLWQILGVLLTLFAISLVRVLLSEGFGLEVYTSTIGMVIVIAISTAIWVFGKMKRTRKAGTDASVATKLSLEDQPKAFNGKMVEQIVVILAVVGTFGGLFYWFQIRPSQIRKECDSYARGKYSNYNSYVSTYTACLHKSGLE